MILAILNSKFTPEQLKLARHARDVFWSSSWRKALPREDQRTLKALLPKGWGKDDTMDHMPGVKAARLAIAKAEGRAT